MKTVIRPEIKRKHIYLHQGIVYDTQPVLNGEKRDQHVSLLSPVGHRTKDTNRYPCMVWVCGGAWRGGRERAAEMLPELMYLAEEGIMQGTGGIYRKCRRENLLRRTLPDDFAGR